MSVVTDKNLVSRVQRRPVMVLSLPIMNLITILLCCLANHVRSLTNEFIPARILAQQKTISENSDLYLTCSTFGKKNTDVHVYLWKNGNGVFHKTQKQDQFDTIFIINKVGLHDSGNYSCVYSSGMAQVSSVTKRGNNIIQILVIANFLPAVVSIAGPDTVMEGDDVEFRCTLSVTLQTLGECQLIQSYLQRNETILQVRPFNVTQKRATFTIEGAVMRDSGHYSCMVLPSKCIQGQEERLFGENAVVLNVTESLFIRLVVSGVVITLVLLLGLCMWWINTKGLLSVLCDQSAESRQAESDMLEEQQEQGQAGAEDLETQDEESFISEEELDYQNDMVAANRDGSGSGSDFDNDGLYSVVDDPGGQVYAMSTRRSKHRR